MRPLRSAILAMALLCMSSSAIAQAPDSLSFQGFVTDPGGAPINNVGVSITFKLYEGSSEIWSETQPSVAITGGVFNVLLGSVSPLNTVRFNRPLLLGIKVGADPEISPRTPLTSTAYALSMRGMYTFYREDATPNESYNVVGGAANNVVAAGVTGATIGGGGGLNAGLPVPNQVLDDFATVGGGALNTASGLHAAIGGGSTNTAGGNSSTVGGGTTNIAGAATSTVGGGNSNTASGLRATVGGGLYNSASGVAGTIAGGRANTVDHLRATVGGGYVNTASGEYATVSGGNSNTAGDTSATIGGGRLNVASGKYATVGGGRENMASGEYATIGGGQENTANNSATVGGGFENTASGLAGTIAGGGRNTASAVFATVGGGDNSMASGISSTVGGGNSNTASGNSSTVGGGNSNTASASCSVIPGGCDNTASAPYSFAAGYQAEAIHEGAFVWSDRSGEIGLASTGPNQFLVRAAGGLELSTDPTSKAGVRLLPGSGSWQSASSVHLKSDFEVLDLHDVLRRVGDLNIRRWRYSGEKSDIRHVGPTSEDFYAAFGLGASQSSITTVDADGVALAAIQGLYELVKEQQAEIERLRRLVEDQR